MKTGRACPYCKSPSIMNPCWYFVDRPDRLQSGGDPECLLHGNDPRGWDLNAIIARRRRNKRRAWRIFAVIFVLLLLSAAGYFYR